MFDYVRGCREEYGDVEIGVETLKKEDRNNPGEEMLFQEFLQVLYKI